MTVPVESSHPVGGPESKAGDAIRKARVLRNPAIVAICTILAIPALGDYIAPYDPEVASPGTRLLPPSLSYPLATDEDGIDVLSRILSSFRIDVSVALIGTLLSLVIGAPLGVVI